MDGIRTRIGQIEGLKSYQLLHHAYATRCQGQHVACCLHVRSTHGHPVSPITPTPGVKYTLRDSNPQPAGCKPAALPVELKVQMQMDVPVLTTRVIAIRAEFNRTCVEHVHLRGNHRNRTCHLTLFRGALYLLS